MECKKVFQELVEACESALRFLNQLGYEGGSPLVGPMQLRLVLAKARTIIPPSQRATNSAFVFEGIHRSPLSRWERARVRAGRLTAKSVSPTMAIRSCCNSKGLGTRG